MMTPFTAKSPEQQLFYAKYIRGEDDIRLCEVSFLGWVLGPSSELMAVTTVGLRCVYTSDCDSTSSWTCIVKSGPNQFCSPYLNLAAFPSLDAICERLLAKMREDLSQAG